MGRYTLDHAKSGKTEQLPEIEVWENQFQNRNYEITIEIPEFTSVCPKTKLPDFGKLTIQYIPAKWCAELKALKYYLLAYRNMGIFYENAVNKIMDDFIVAVKPKSARITGIFNTRGGMNSSISVSYQSPK